MCRLSPTDKSREALSPSIHSFTKYGLSTASGLGTGSVPEKETGGSGSDGLEDAESEAVTGLLFAGAMATQRRTGWAQGQGEARVVVVGASRREDMDGL